jgi:excisionase family DNA binding protein
MHEGHGMPQDTPSLVGSAEACDLLRIDRSTLSRWVAAGKITPAQRLPGQNGAFLFRERDVLALMKLMAA